MKVKILSRSSVEYMRETKYDIHKVTRNYDARVHPFEMSREYTRALNSVKLSRMFAKPLMCALSGHSDVVSCLAKHPVSLSTIISGSYDGQMKIWNIAQQKCMKSLAAHNSCVRSICVTPHNHNNTDPHSLSMFSVDDSQNIKQWNLDESNNDCPKNTIICSTPVMCLDHHWTKPLLVSCGEVVNVWDTTIGTTEPVWTYKWDNNDSTHFIKFNRIETDICVSSSSDRSITLHDIRQSTPLRKVVMRMKTNGICWNPMEAFVLTCANEDNDLYSFDMRKLSVPIQVHKDHVSAVIAVDYSPTGKQFVSAGYDKTIRIFSSDNGRSSDVYHTKRMQRMTDVVWSNDNQFIIASSDEMDIRMWKANASQKLGKKSFREELSFRYQHKLQQKFANYPEIKRIARHRHVPKHIFHEQKQKRLMIESQKRKESNRRAHSKPGTVPYTSERTKNIISEHE